MGRTQLTGEPGQTSSSCLARCAGTRVGTPNYQAPEMLRTHREEAPGYTMAADWWSYGVLVYEVSEAPVSGSSCMLVLRC